MKWTPNVLTSVSFDRSEVSLEIDNRLCKKHVDKDPSECFPDAKNAADYLAALSAVDRLHFPYPIKSVRSKSIVCHY